MVSRRWDGKMPARAVRLEFRLQPTGLHNRGIRSMEDYVEMRTSLMRNLTHGFMRVVTHKPSKGNQSRTPVIPEWTQVQETCDR